MFTYHRSPFPFPLPFPQPAAGFIFSTIGKSQVLFPLFVIFT